MRLPALKIDPFTLGLIATVGIATLLPAPEALSGPLDYVVDAAVALLFFLHGARLAPSAVKAGWLNWPLQIAVLLLTFGLFPILGIGWSHMSHAIELSMMLAQGLLFLCCQPSTVQSSIAFTSLARGNVPAAVCAATLSNIAGIALTPLLIGILFAKSFPLSWTSVIGIAMQLLLPFILGQLLRSLISRWVVARKPMLTFVGVARSY